MMDAKNDDAAKAMRALFDALEEAVLKMTDEEVLAEVREQGIDPKVAASRVSQVLRNGLVKFQKAKLRDAQIRYEQRVAQLQEKKRALPSSAADRRALLGRVLKERPQLQDALTAHFREFKDLSDADIESYLQQLYDLGVLPELSERE